MDIFQKLSMEKRSAMELLFQNCTEKVKNYMFTMDVAAGQTFIQAGELCRNAAVPGQRGRADNTCSLKQTRCQMAEEIGFSIKTMDRSIKKLEEEGMLRLEKGKIQVDQSGYLEMKEYIEQCIEGRS